MTGIRSSIEFVFGMMIALLYRAGVRVPMWATVGLIAVGFIWLTQSTAVPSVPRPFSAGIAATLIVAAMSLSSMSSPKHRPLIGGVTFLADISYALYCTHLLSFSLVAWVTIKLAISPVGHAWTYFVAMLATGLVIAAGTHLLFEKPITKFLKKLIERPDGRVNSAITKFRPSLRPSTI
jgi:peptidoglycan/LPS O-acetylase OafA/YrhL